MDHGSLAGAFALARLRGSRRRGGGLRCVSSAAAPPPARSSTKLPVDDSRDLPRSGRGGAPRYFALQSAHARNCHSERGPMRDGHGGDDVCRAPEESNRGHGQASCSHRISGSRARAAQRAPTAVPRDRRRRARWRVIPQASFYGGSARCAVRGRAQVDGGGVREPVRGGGSTPLEPPGAWGWPRRGRGGSARIYSFAEGGPGGYLL